MIKHGVAESTKLQGCMNVIFVADEDIDNGSIVANGGLVSGYSDVYMTKKPTAIDRVYIVIHSVYGYDDRFMEDKNEDNYTNKMGIPFRTYELNPDRKFKVSSNMITPIDATTPIAEDQYVSADGTYKLAASATFPTDTAFVGVIETIEETGFPYFGSSRGVQTSDMGYVLDTRIVKVKIRVIKND